MNTKKEVKVSGHLEAISEVYHMKLSWIDDAGKRRRKSKSTGLAERGNKNGQTICLSTLCVNRRLKLPQAAIRQRQIFILILIMRIRFPQQKR